MNSNIVSRIQKNIPLAAFTTMQLGGNAAEYISCTSNQDIIDALAYAREKNMRTHVLGGGSNTIFSDKGFSGLVIHIRTKGINESQKDGKTVLTVQAGEDWDGVVQHAIQHNLAGIECLSGIPGSCGAVPFQNVGAYGQEVAETIDTVFAIERSTAAPIQFTNTECQFGYRISRFKTLDKDKYIITSVSFALTPNGIPTLRYGELKDAVGDSITPGIDGLMTIRTAVLQLRKKKSMILDPTDPNSISCGSFFTNPIIDKADFRKNTTLKNSNIPVFPEGDVALKLSAAWLVEHAGFAKGAVRGNVGISQNHSLALINKGGTTAELLAFAQEIQTAVQETFGIKLEMEPIVVP